MYGFLICKSRGSLQENGKYFLLLQRKKIISGMSLDVPIPEITLFRSPEFIETFLL